MSGSSPRNKTIDRREPKRSWIRGCENTEPILTLIRQIPTGQVATYGQIAHLAGIPRNSRQVGSILRSLPPASDVPWFRVVNSRGEISPRGNPDAEFSQRNRLESEGIEFNGQGRVSLKTFGWVPEA